MGKALHLAETLFAPAEFRGKIRQSSAHTTSQKGGRTCSGTSPAYVMLRASTRKDLIFKSCGGLRFPFLQWVSSSRRALSSHLGLVGALGERGRGLSPARLPFGLVLPTRLAASGRQGGRGHVDEGSDMAVSGVESALASVGELREDFDRNQFKRELNLLALRVPLSKIGSVRSKLEKLKLLLRLPRVKTIVSAPDDSPGEKLVLLSEAVTTSAFPEALETLVRDLQLGAPVPYTRVLGYDYLGVDQVLRALLPKDIVGEVPTSFETIGHIAHLNLREEQLPYKKLIGRVILDKNERIKTVVNKIHKIENEFRVLPMEVIAGSQELETVVIQHGVRFKLNFAQVYWNSRLEREHHRLITETFRRGDCLLDMTCGVGPFAIPAAKMGCKVYANDLNPKCAEYTRINCKLNKIPEADAPRVYCMDARAFVRHVVRGSDRKRKMGSEEEEEAPLGPVVFDHAVINLPATGLDFVDVFKGLFPRKVWQDRALPMVHCYTFVGKDLLDAESSLRELKVDEREVKEALFKGVVRRVETLLGTKFEGEDRGPVVREVRDVAPNKRMVLISFRVPARAAYSE